MRIWYVISLCLFCACGTSKKSTDTERHATSVSLSDSVFKKDSLSAIERILSNERLNAHILVVEWSGPDSGEPVSGQDLGYNHRKGSERNPARRSFRPDLI